VRFRDDGSGKVLCAKIQEKVMNLRDTMEIDDADGNKITEVKKRVLTPLRDQFLVKIKNGPDLT